MNAKRADIRQQGRDTYLAGIRPTDGPKPNIVLVFVDDMGYGDISCFGSRAIHTPHLDRLAERGVRLTNFYAASPVCSPSRFSCLTGRYPNRGFVDGVFFPTGNVQGRLYNRYFFPHGIRGILPDEITAAEALRAGGYHTGIFGKWHLGDRPPHLPNENGFDHFFGSYYSVDMHPYAFYRNDQVAIEADVDLSKVTKLITSEIKGYIDEHHDDPFFIYYASPYPHHPAHASADFAGKSHGGTYGDCVQELDFSIGEVYGKLEEYGIADNTLFIFTSDNGPWFEGNPGLHRGRKGLGFDGGQMVPFIACWPGKIPAGTTVDEPAMNIDFFPTFLWIAGIPLPDDREIDGLDMMPLLTGETAESPHDELLFINFDFFHKSDPVFAVRTRDHFKYTIRHKHDTQKYTMNKQGPFLFDLSRDQNESYDVSAHFPEKAERLRRILEEKSAAFKANPRGWR